MLKYSILWQYFTYLLWNTMNKIKNTCLGLIMFIFAILTGCVPIGGGTTNNNTNVVSGQLSFSTSSLTLATGQSTSITLTLAGSSGVGSTLVSLQESPLQLVNLSPTICSVSTLVPTCTITVTAESQQESTSIIAIASGYTAPQLAVNVSIPLVGWTPTADTPQVDGRANNVGLTSDQLGNLYLAYQGNESLNIYRYQFGPSQQSWQQIAGALNMSLGAASTSIAVDGQFSVNIMYLAESNPEDKPVIAFLSALPDKINFSSSRRAAYLQTFTYIGTGTGVVCPSQISHDVTSNNAWMALAPGDGYQVIAYSDTTLYESVTVTTESGVCFAPGYRGNGRLSVFNTNLTALNTRMTTGTVSQVHVAATPTQVSTAYPIYLAYADGLYNSGISVMKLSGEGEEWELVGNPNITNSPVNFISLAVDTNGTPYIAFEDSSAQNRLTVMTYLNNAWQNLGSSNISVGKATYISLSINPGTNIPFVAYQDSGLGNNIVVQQYNSINNSWNQLGSVLPNSPNNYGTYTFMTMLLQPPYQPPYSYQPALAYQNTLSGQSTSNITTYYYQP